MHLGILEEINVTTLLVLYCYQNIRLKATPSGLH